MSNPKLDTSRGKRHARRALEKDMLRYFRSGKLRRAQTLARVRMALVLSGGGTPLPVPVANHPAT
jgi:hypothetical protein